MPGRTSAQPKRAIAWEKAHPYMERILKLGVIEENTSHHVDNIATIVLVSKSQRLTKGDKADAKRRQKKDKQMKTRTEALHLPQQIIV